MLHLSISLSYWYIQRSNWDSWPTENPSVCSTFSFRVPWRGWQWSDHLSAVGSFALSYSIFTVTKMSLVCCHQQRRPASDPFTRGYLASGSPPTCLTPHAYLGANKSQTGIWHICFLFSYLHILFSFKRETLQNILGQNRVVGDMKHVLWSQAGVGVLARPCGLMGGRLPPRVFAPFPWNGNDICVTFLL